MLKVNVIKLTSSKFFPWISLLILVLIWGSSFILIKRGLEVYSSVEVGAIRIFVSFVVLLPFAIRSIGKMPWNKIKYIIIIGVIGTGVPAFLFAKAQTHIDSSLAGILNSLTPLFTLVMGLVFFKQKTTWINAVGIFMGLIGAAGLIHSTSNGAFEFHFSFAIYVIMATLLYAIQSNMIKYYLNDVNPITIASLGFFFMGVPVSILLFFFSDFPTRIVSHPDGITAFAYVAVLGIFASAIAISLYNRLVQTTSAIFASSVTYFVPILALFWGINDGEKIPLIAFVYILVILLGVLLVNKNKK